LSPGTPLIDAMRPPSAGPKSWKRKGSVSGARGARGARGGPGAARERRRRRPGEGVSARTR
jgi:hypothetical protein